MLSILRRPYACSSPPRSFGTDPYPGEPRILFVGLAESTHTHSWIDLLKESRLNVRMFALPTFRTPDAWKVRTYVTLTDLLGLDPQTRVQMQPETPESLSEADRLWFWPHGEPIPGVPPAEEPEAPAKRWLWRILRDWRPHIVHTLGIDSASYFHHDVQRALNRSERPTWVVQVRGGPDLALHRLLPEHAGRIRSVLTSCDHVIADNDVNYRHCRELGVPEDRLTPLGVVPGTGGIDVEAMGAISPAPPSQRERLILWPKAYECPQSKGQSVLEGIRLAWPKIRPCRFKFLAVVQPEMRMWVQTLPADLRDSIEMHDRVPRAEVLRLMGEARVMLAPSMSDGIPNCLYEAMAAGAAPIVSPLDSITPLAAEETNVLYARNLYPDEIAVALVRAMTDDRLVDAAARANRELVGRAANRKVIGPRLIDWYRRLALSRMSEVAA